MHRYRIHFQLYGTARTWVIFAPDTAAAWGYATTHVAAEYPDAVVVDVVEEAI